MVTRRDSAGPDSGLDGQDAPRSRLHGAGAAAITVVGLALLARLLEALFERAVYNDGPRFLAMATAFLAGDWRSAVRDDFHPLTAIAIAGVNAALGVELETAGELVSVLAGGAAAFAIWQLAREQLGDRVAFVAGILFALHPRLRESSSGVQSDGLHLACFALAALHAWRALDRQRLADAALAGLYTGLGYLTRPESLGVAVVLGGWLAADLLQRRLELRRMLALGAVYAVVLATVSIPYILAMHEISGRWSITQKKDFLAWAPRALALSSDPSPATASPEPMPTPAPMPAAPPLEAPAPAAAAPQVAPPQADLAEPTALEIPPQDVPESGATRGAARAALSETLKDGLRGLHPVLLLLVALGLGAILRAESGARRTALYGISFLALFVGLLLMLHLMAGYVSRRHFLPAAVLLLPLAGRGTLALSEGILQRIPSLRPLRAMQLLGWALVLGVLIEMTLPKGEPSKVAREDAARWLRDHRAPAAVASHRARDAYYAGAAHVVLAVDDPGGVEGMLRSAQADGAQFAILDLEMLAGHGLPPWVHELHREKYRQKEVLVLELGP